MTFSPLSANEIAKFQFVPQAVVNRAPDFFASKGVRFHDGHDDLDDFTIAEMLLNETLPFALIRYRGHPPNQTTLFLPADQSLSSIDETVLSILAGFGLGRSSLAWIRQRLDTPF